MCYVVYINLKMANDNLELINLFNKKENQLYNTHDHMFVGVDEKNPTSTNLRMERLNMYIEEFKKLQKIDPLLLDIYPFDKYQNTHTYKLYGLIDNNKEVTYVSHSYICLLKYAAQVFPNIYDDWNIVCLST